MDVRVGYGIVCPVDSNRANRVLKNTETTRAVHK